MILADSCRRRESKALGNTQDYAGDATLSVSRLGLPGPYTPSYSTKTWMPGTRLGMTMLNYRDSKSSATAGLRLSRLPSERFFTSTLPSARLRGPTST